MAAKTRLPITPVAPMGKGRALKRAAKRGEQRSDATRPAATTQATTRPETARPVKTGSRRPKSRSALPTRERILRAALQAFAARGVDAATTREIAALADLSEGALYRHFASKEEIARSLFDAVHDRLARLVRAAAAHCATIEGQAEAVVDAYCQTADDDWPLFSYHLLSTTRFLPTPEGQDNPVAAVEEIVASAIARGEIEKTDARLLAAMALGLVLQPALHKAHGRLDGPLGGAAPSLKRAVAVLFSAYRRKK